MILVPSSSFLFLTPESVLYGWSWPRGEVTADSYLGFSRYNITRSVSTTYRFLLIRGCYDSSPGLQTRLGCPLLRQTEGADCLRFRGHLSCHCGILVKERWFRSQNPTLNFIFKDLSLFFFLVTPNESLFFHAQETWFYTHLLPNPSHSQETKDK